MADVNPPRDASARQILDALARLEGEIAAARREVAGIKRTAGVGERPLTQSRRVAGDVEATTAALGRETNAQNEGLNAELRRLDAARQRLVVEEQLARVERLRTQGTLLAGGGAHLNDAEAAEARRFIESGGQLPINRANVSPLLAPHTTVSEPDYDRRDYLRYTTEQMYARPRTGSSGIANETAGELERLTRAQGEYGSSATRSAALSGDFFRRMETGSASLREMRSEVTTTISKFAGWTAAGAAVYGVLAAIHQLRDGAIASVSGVSQLQRFIDDLDTDRAQQGFRDLSKDLNVGISDAAETEGQFAKVFKDVSDVQTASSVALTATKLDNIETADSYRYFTAVVQEFGLSASDLPLVLDQINAAQNRLGANVQQVVPAIARSASAVKNAGGDFNELLALIATTQVASGQTGRLIGTGFYRGAANFFRRPDNAETLRTHGLNPDQGFTQVLDQAVRRSREFSGGQRREIAAAIFGPQYGGSIGQALLNSPDRYRRALRETSPEAALGSTAHELDTLLKRVDERIDAIGHGLERLGSALGESGAFAPLGAGLVLLTSMVDEVTHLVELFNDAVPASLRPTVATLLEAYAAVRLLRGTAVGAGIAQATGIGFVSDPEARARRTELSGLEGAAGVYGGQAQSAASRAQGLQAQAVTAQRARDQLQAQTLVASSEAELTALRSKMVALDERAASLIQESAEYAALAERARSEELVLRERAAALGQRGAAVDAEILAAEQARQPGAFGRTTGRAASAVTGGAAASYAGAKAAEGAALGRAAAADVEIAAAQTGFAARASAAAAVATTGAGRIATGASQVAGASARWGRNVLRAADGMNVMGKALTAFIIGQIFFDAVKSQEEAFAAQIEDMGRGVTTISNLRARQKGLIDQYNQADGNIPYQIFDTAIHAPGVRALTGAGPQKNAEANQEAIARQYLLDQSIQTARRRSADSPFERVGYSYTELLNQFAEDVQQLRRGQITRAEFGRRYELFARSASASIDVLSGGGRGLPAALKKLQGTYSRALEHLRPGEADPFVQFQHATLDQNLALLSAIEDRAQLSGVSDRQLDTAGRGLTYLISKYGRTNDRRKLQRIVQAQQTFDQLLSLAQRQLQDAIAGTTLPGRDIAGGDYTASTASAQLGSQQRSEDAIYSRTIDQLERQRKELYDGIGYVGRGLARRERNLSDLQERRDELRGLGGLGKALSALGIGQSDAELTQQIDTLSAQVKKQRRAVADAGASIAQRASKIQALIDELREQQYQSRTADIGLRSDYAGSLADSKIDQLDEQVDAARQILDLARNFKGRDRANKVLEAQTKLNEAISQRAEQMLQDTQLRGDLRTSEITGSGPEADLQRIESQLNTAEQVLAAAQTQASGPNRESDIIQAQIRVNDLRRQVAEQVRENAKRVADLAVQLYQSQIDVQKASLTDPVAIDQLTLKADQFALGHVRRSQFDSDAEYQIARNQALAKLLSDRKQLTGDIANEQLSEAEFEHNVGRLTDAEYIKKLRDILKLKGITKDLKRQLLTDIYNLQHEGDGNLELNVGSIKLPTFYDVRRALAAGRSAGQGGTTVMVDNRPQVTVQVANASDVPAVGDAIDRALGTTVSANLRAAGLT